MTNTISVAVIQFPVLLDISSNLDHLLSFITSVDEETLVITPEGAISGYSQDPNFVKGINTQMLEQALKKVREEVVRRKIHLVVGSCIEEAEKWCNAALYMGPRQELSIYRKINLAMSERGVFQAGHELPVFSLSIRGVHIKLGIQMCREIRYPEQWQHLARKGTQIFAFLNNAVGDSEICPTWRSHLISRAAETQRFLLAANNAEPEQKCPTMIIAPSGKVLFEEVSACKVIGKTDIAINEVSDWALLQARTDIVRVTT
jgi:predicted amidohydrolase